VLIQAFRVKSDRAARADQNTAVPDENGCNATSCSVTREGPAWSRWLIRFTFGR